MSRLLYLASQSPRRSQLLTQLGIVHELLLPDPDEDAEGLEAVKHNEAPKAYVARVTALKLDAAVARLGQMGKPAAPILCADTTVALGRQILGKPQDAAQAKHMLQALSNKTHRVLTAVAVQSGSGKRARRFTALSESQVTFAELSKAQIQAYVASQEPFGKAGAYAVQGRAAGFIAHIKGSYSGIMGLPMFETSQLLRQFGWKI